MHERERGKFITQISTVSESSQLNACASKLSAFKFSFYVVYSDLNFTIFTSKKLQTIFALHFTALGFQAYFINQRISVIKDTLVLQINGETMWRS